jgi:hypothetical protein
MKTFVLILATFGALRAIFAMFEAAERNAGLLP